MKRIVVAMILILLLGFGAIWLVLRQNEAAPGPSIVAVNDIVMGAMEKQNRAAAASEIIDELTPMLDELYNDTTERNNSLSLLLFAVMSAFAMAFGVLLIAVYRGVLKPFRLLKRFAQNVAGGNLDIPLKMDRKRNFGAFTESFDLMRTELLRAREAERKANQSKKELVASLSHDIKTPLASVKAVSEVMLVTMQDDKQRAQMAVISAKADQIDLLVNNLFSATLEELQELKVSPCVIPSDMLGKLLSDADYARRVTMRGIPQCMVVADPVRLAQVFDNVISNSYKYSGTCIEVAMELDMDKLWVDIIDFGSGVSEKEQPLLTQKYFRGENAEGKSGTGIGLYISNYFMMQMSGEMRCKNHPDGFSVRIGLKLA